MKNVDVNNFADNEKRKARRGKYNKNKKVSKSFRILGVNAAGLKPKLSTFQKVLDSLKPSLFLIEESKYKEEGKLKVNNYIIFELVRESNDEGGGLAIGCTKDLKPVLARKRNDETEALTVDICVEKMKIKCVVGYGLQENALKDGRGYLPEPFRQIRTYLPEPLK